MELLKIKSRYWYRTKQRERKTLTLKEIFNQQPRGLEIIYDKVKNEYYAHYPVTFDWYPENDLRTENQGKYSFHNQSIISLDPGIRKFCVGYDPQGNVIEFGNGASKKLIRMVKRIDTLENREERLKGFRRVKNYVTELHWKVINYLLKHYDVILFPPFETSKMVRGKKLSRETKRLMNIFSFYQFKTKLKYKCLVTGKKIKIVDESWTSKTCTNCLEINDNLGSSETFKCAHCNLTIDRDCNGSRNILIKNLELR